MSDINLHYRTIKQSLKRSNLSGSFLGAKYRFSPYMACEHGCLYCDGRAERYYIEGRFERDIVIRSNLPEVLRREIGKIREKGVISIGSGVSDAYQPVEEKEKLMKQAAEILIEHRRPAIILTKSALILRDIDLWAQLQEVAGFMLVVSLVFHNDEIRRIFEPRTASVEERLHILTEFKKRGCSTGVLAMPFMPYVADSEDDVGQLFSSLENCEVDFVMPGALTLRPGRQKDTYIELIAKEYPQFLDGIRALYAEDRLSGVPLRTYLDEMNLRFTSSLRAHNLTFLVPHYYYREKTHNYDEVKILLHHMVELFRDRGINIDPLKTALGNYIQWLETRKRDYNRHPSWRYEELDVELIGLIKSGEIESIIGNTKLCAFLEEIVIGRKIFNYLDLKSY